MSNNLIFQKFFILDSSPWFSLIKEEARKSGLLRKRTSFNALLLGYSRLAIPQKE
jgi:hypothetical protein